MQKIQKNSGEWFRSTDLLVMSQARFLLRHPALTDNILENNAFKHAKNIGRNVNFEMMNQGIHVKTIYPHVLNTNISCQTNFDTRLKMPYRPTRTVLQLNRLEHPANNRKVAGSSPVRSTFLFLPGSFHIIFIVLADIKSHLLTVAKYEFHRKTLQSKIKNY